ncbi:hypothetical protein [Lentzea jiangxiensis]|uniref:hypothetical protein n=1 Tax=Lentzea jiangxiensis TaxID=641025 RepID=UPI00115F7DFA|nr:hypothetical protein [Lentzea jiangxiensis]
MLFCVWFCLEIPHELRHGKTMPKQSARPKIRLLGAALLAAVSAIAAPSAAQAADSGKYCHKHVFNQVIDATICHHWWPDGNGATNGYWEVTEIHDVQENRLRIEICKDGLRSQADWNNTQWTGVKYISFRIVANKAGSGRSPDGWRPRLLLGLPNYNC